MCSELSAIEITALSKKFKTSWVLSDVNLIVPAGQLVAVVGPSGCGKSTLLKTIAGLLPATSGEIRLAKVPVSERSPDRLSVGMVFQDMALYPHFTVEKNLRFSIRAQAITKTEIASRVKDVAERLKIVELLDRYPADLSGGERQRVAIGRAIIRRPKVLLLDEPLSQLDAHLRNHLRALIVELHTQLSATTLYVTHDASEALEVADRMLVMSRGRIIQDGTPEQIYDTPGNQWVAEFVGNPPINIISGTLRGNTLKIAASQVLVLREAIAAGSNFEKDIAVNVGFRPSSVQVADQQALVDLDTAAFTTKAIVQRIYRREDRFVGIVRSEHGEHCLISPNKHALQVGATIQLRVSSDQLIVFDASSGIRLS